MKNYFFTPVPPIKKKILIVDDEVDILKLLEIILQDEYIPITKTSGLEALTSLNNGEIPDLIISDIEMPYFNGADFIKSLKISGYFRNIPVLVLSGSDSLESIQARIPYQINGFLAKPFNPTFLKETIKSLLN